MRFEVGQIDKYNGDYQEIDEERSFYENMFFGFEG